ncbi:alpha/beta hydrolase [Kitasatospora sp. RB6PN24]|uniref:alpha/beta fold hydrolase n=1 Tax=Kitasatospora humi TaxID=2893891 RepID=UPI001E6380C8|nr:alpha/beta hydrolase [Kitasatospora humi]MCC9305840.1 alpha/beta hydrolase [Kitasatospora humi]
MTTELDIRLTDGRTLHVYDWSPEGATGRGVEPLPVLWHHGTPGLGLPPQPLFAAARRQAIRWISYDRPGYGGSTPAAGRDLAAAAADTAAVADALGLPRFGALGVSGGASHALACAALLPERVVGVVSVAGLAPYGAPGLDWFAGMYPGGKAELRAAVAERAQLAAELASSEFDPEMFTERDHAALQGEWSWLADTARLGTASGLDGMLDDDLAYVAPWGFDPGRITVPVLILHGGADRVVPAGHGEWLARAIPGAELRRHPADGHLSILNAAACALPWLRVRA